MTKGWRKESKRHSQSAKGIKTGRKAQAQSNLRFKDDDMMFPKSTPDSPAPDPFKEMPKSTFHLPIEQSIYVPSKDKKGKSLPPEEVRRNAEETKKQLSKWYGGNTSIKAVGGYVTQDGTLIEEDVLKVTSFSTREAHSKNRKKLKNFLLKKRDEWNQESIGYEFEGDLYYF